MRQFLPILLALLAGCSGEGFSEQEMRLIGEMRLSQLPNLATDPSNAVADDARAAALGEALFFDTRLSVDGTVSCATCHLPDRQFQDDLPLAKALGTTERRTMPLANVAHGQWFMWDGRKDSLWSQALAPLEDAREHGGNRLAYARLIGEAYADSYAQIFGPLPQLPSLPVAASPLGTVAERQAWAALDDSQREAVDGVFANIGKALEAFQRTILHEETKFDRFAEAIVARREPQGDAAFNSLEIEGLKLFLGKANCVECHSGPRFTDDFFHNTGVPPVDGLPDDRGRAQAVTQVLADPFNCLGVHSDAAPDECTELRFMVRESPEFERAFKTPSLRGVASREPYMHSGQIASLEEVIEHYSAAPKSVSGQSELRGVIFTDRGKAALIAFLKTLD